MLIAAPELSLVSPSSGITICQVVQPFLCYATSKGIVDAAMYMIFVLSRCWYVGCCENY